jgi:hypothetical protein
MSARPAAGGYRPTTEIMELGMRLLREAGGVPRSQRAKMLGIASASAADYIKIAKAFDGRLPRDRPLAIDFGALAALAQPNVPDSVRDQAIRLALSGARVDRRTAEALIFGVTGK